MSEPAPTVDVVVIGLNAGRTLRSCLESVLASRGVEIAGIYYVDSGSTDRSAEIAASYPEVTVLRLNQRYPSPGAGRNLGWKAGSAPFVQFLDSDTIMDPDWLARALPELTGTAGAVRGWRKELAPDASVYNWIADQEWNAPAGDCDTFGGDALLRREILEETGGYDEELTGGEDPELSERVRQNGWRVVQLAAPMTQHDLAMHTAAQYWKRAFRTGYGYAAVVARTGFRGQGFWKKELLRIFVRGGASLGLIALGLLGAMFVHPAALLASLAGLLLIFYPRLLRTGKLAQSLHLSQSQARIYAWHCCLVIVPEFFGALRYFAGALTNRPLRNRVTPTRPEKPVLSCSIHP